MKTIAETIACCAFGWGMVAAAVVLHHLLK